MTNHPKCADGLLPPPKRADLVTIPLHFQGPPSNADLNVWRDQPARAFVSTPCRPLLGLLFFGTSPCLPRPTPSGVRRKLNVPVRQIPTAWTLLRLQKCPTDSRSQLRVEPWTAIARGIPDRRGISLRRSWLSVPVCPSPCFRRPPLPCEASIDPAIATCQPWISETLDRSARRGLFLQAVDCASTPLGDRK